MPRQFSPDTRGPRVGSRGARRQRHDRSQWESLGNRSFGLSRETVLSVAPFLATAPQGPEPDLDRELALEALEHEAFVDGDLRGQELRLVTVTLAGDAEEVAIDGERGPVFVNAAGQLDRPALQLAQENVGTAWPDMGTDERVVYLCDAVRRSRAMSKRDVLAAQFAVEAVRQQRDKVEWFEIVYDKILIKQEPETEARSWGLLQKGLKLQVLAARQRDPQGREWIELTPAELRRSCAASHGQYGARGFALIDGRPLGLSRLVRGPLPLTQCPEKAPEEAEAGPTRDEVLLKRSRHLATRIMEAREREPEAQARRREESPRRRRVPGGRSQQEVDARWEAMREVPSNCRALQYSAAPLGPDLVVHGFRLQPTKIRSSGGPELDFFVLNRPWEGQGPRPALLYLHGLGALKEAGGLPELARDCWWLDRAPPELIIIIPHLQSVRMPWVSAGVKSTLVHALDRHMDTLNMDPCRLYVSGFSMGGHGAWELALDAACGEAPFAAAVPVAGQLLEVDRAPELMGFPVWVFHGANDQVNPVAFDDKATRLISEACSQTDSELLLRYTRYQRAPDAAQPRDGHASDELAYADDELWEWLLRHRKHGAGLGRRAIGG